MPPATAPAATATGAVISNGVVTLGVNREGDLNYNCAGAGDTGCPPNSVGGQSLVGLRYAPLNLDAISPGCFCEGWGLADADSGLTGYANGSAGDDNIAVQSFSATATRAIATIAISDPSIPNQSMLVRHDYRPSPLTPNLFVDTITVSNTGTEALDDLRFRRVMDWDVEPTAFDEWVTIAGSSPDLLFDSDNGFASSNPLAGNSYINSEIPCGENYSGTCTFIDLGEGGSYPAETTPDDHGALFDFGFGALGVGDTRSFNIYYGAAPSEIAALTALSDGGAQIYSLGQSNCSGDTIATCSPGAPEAGTDAGPSQGRPATFIFGFVTTLADLGVTMSDSPDPVQVGQNLTYSINVTNSGPDDTEANLSQSLPAGVSLVSVAPSQGSCGPTGVSCNLGTIPGGEDAQVTVVVTADSAGSGSLTSTATVSGSNPDDNSSNDSATATTTVVSPEADLGVTMSDSPDPVQVGQNLTYSINVTNDGPDDASAVQVTQNLPASVSLLSVTPSQGSCGPTGVSCNLGTIPEGEDAQVEVVVQPSGFGTGSLTSTATVSGSTSDENPPNDSATATTQVASSGTISQLPAPVLFQNANAALVSGTVLIKLPDGTFKPLEGEEQVPFGSVIDTTNGVVAITSATNGGQVQTANFFAGVFRLVQMQTQNGGVFTQLVLDEGPSSRALARKGPRKLWGNGKGNYKTKGGYGSATVRGTKWLTRDSDEGTLIKVVRGIVIARDFARKKIIKLSAGKKLLVTPPGRPPGKVR